MCSLSASCQAKHSKQNQVFWRRTLVLTKTASPWLISDKVLDSLNEICYFKTIDIYYENHAKHWGHKSYDVLPVKTSKSSND